MDVRNINANLDTNLGGDCILNGLDQQPWQDGHES